MDQITLFGLHLSLPTVLLAAVAVLSVAVAVGVSRRRAHARRAVLPPLIFEVHDRPEPGMRPMMMYPPPSPPPPPRAPAWDAAPAPRRASAEGLTVRMPRWGEPSREYLPGHLEVEAGGRPGEAIRFVRTAGDTADVTLGRGDGPAYSHVKLAAETVSRRHARLCYANGRWTIMNLSRTNPTLVNGEELLASEGARLLADGDVIEMGEMVFRFRAR